MTETAIRLTAARRDFTNGSHSFRAVDDISLEVPAGIIFGFLGPNGAGKTTTIRLLLGLLEPTAGRIEVLGYNLQSQADEVRARTGALLEHNGIYEQLSAEENLEFYGRANRMTQVERQTRIKELLTHLGLWERRKERAGKWSKGMKQKLALARVLLHRPPLVLLDEPTAGLDVQASNTIRDDLEALTEREGVTIFLTTHNMAEAERLCSQVGVIRQGKLVAVGHPNELRSRAGKPRVDIFGRGFTPDLVSLLQAQEGVLKVEAQNGHLSIDLKQEIDPAPFISLVVSAGAQVAEVHQGKASLEEVFLTLMKEEK